MENSFTTWSIDPEIIAIGPLSLRWYGLLFALGFVVGYYIMEWMFKQENKPTKELDNLTVYMAVSTVIGARLGHVFFYNWDYYGSHPEEILMVWKGGLASHGAAIGILIGLWLFVRKRKDFSYLWIVDRIVVTVALAGFFIRMGNLMNSEILGKAADVSWAFVFTRLPESEQFPRHPVQIYEALSYLAVFVLLFIRYKSKKASIRSGELFGWFLTLIFGFRFIWEFFKVKQVESSSHYNLAMDLNMGHLLSIPLILIGLIFLLRTRLKKV